LGRVLDAEFSDIQCTVEKVERHLNTLNDSPASPNDHCLNDLMSQKCRSHQQFILLLVMLLAAMQAYFSSLAGVDIHSE
jgi:hypothetical protein